MKGETMGNKGRMKMGRMHKCFVVVLVVLLLSFSTMVQNDASEASRGVLPVTLSDLGVAQVATNEYTTFILASDGELFAVGSNEGGIFGIGSNANPLPNDNNLTPQSITAANNGLTFSAIAVGTNHVISLTYSGECYTWGDNFEGQIGLGDNDTLGTGNGGRNYRPNNISTANNGITFASICASAFTSYGLTSDGELYAWGANSSGNLGLGDKTMMIARNYSPNNISTSNGGITFASISAGYNATFALTAEGELFSWGHNWDGFLGLGDQDSSYPYQGNGGRNFRPTSVSSYNSGITFASISAGESHVLALDGQGELFAWGRNTQGRLGLGDNDSPGAGNRNYSPTSVSDANGGITFSSIAAKSQSFARTANGETYTWGYNSTGSLGLGDCDNIPRNFSPINVSSTWGDMFDRVFLGTVNTYGIRPTGEIYAWGDNAEGQLCYGDGLNLTRNYSPGCFGNVLKPKLTGVTYIAGSTPDSLNGATLTVSEVSTLTGFAISFNIPMATDTSIASAATVELREAGSTENLLDEASVSGSIQTSAISSSWADSKTLSVDIPTGAIENGKSYELSIKGYNKEGRLFGEISAETIQFSTKAKKGDDPPREPEDIKPGSAEVGIFSNNGPNTGDTATPWLISAIAMLLLLLLLAVTLKRQNPLPDGQ
jgi:LPXTG-motif cell wall-anchored protein